MRKANLQLRKSYHDKHRVDATLTNGWSTISQCMFLFQPLWAKSSYTTNSVIAPSRK